MVLLRAAVKFFEFLEALTISKIQAGVFFYLKDTKNGDTGSIEGI